MQSHLPSVNRYICTMVQPPGNGFYFHVEPFPAYTQAVCMCVYITVNRRSAFTWWFFFQRWWNKRIFDMHHSRFLNGSSQFWWPEWAPSDVLLPCDDDALLIEAACSKIWRSRLKFIKHRCCWIPKLGEIEVPYNYFSVFFYVSNVALQ